MYLIITNPVAGGGRSLRLQQQVIDRLKSDKLDFELRLTPEEKGKETPVWEKYEQLILIGGDGTLHRLLNYWGIPPIPVALIGGGSGNDFSRCSLGTKHWREQLDIALTGRAKPVDLGICNGLLFGTGVGIGFDGKIAHLLQKKTFFKGFTRYLSAVMAQVFSYREKKLELSSQSFKYSGASFMLTVGNTCDFGGGFKVTPGANPFDAKFQVCLVRRVSRLNRLLNLNRVTQGKHEHLQFVHLFEEKELVVKSDELVHCHMDGEHYHWDKFNIAVKPNALLLMQKHD